MSGLETAGAVASIITAAVTTLTLIVLIVYTIETYKLRLEAQRTNDNSTMPVILIQTAYRAPHTKSSSLVIRNLGSGPAFNIQIGSIQIGEKLATFDHPIVLASGQDEFATVSGLREAKRDQVGGYDDGKIHAAVDLLGVLKSIPGTGETKCVVRYTNTSGKPFRSSLTLDHNAGDIESFVRFDGVQAL